MGGQNVKNTMLDKMLEFLAPHLCCGCGKIGTLLCDSCKEDIIKKPFNTCILCFAYRRDGVCKKHDLPYSKAEVVGLRSGALKKLIDGFKFQNTKIAARELAELLHQRLPALDPATLLVPVPTAQDHVRERGYDHMLLIAQYFSSKRGIKLAKGLLGRYETATQHSANRKTRLLQAKKAFTLRGVVDPTTPYLVLDDTFTTGSTIREASQLLFDAGAKNLSVAVIARQPLD